MGSGCGSVGGAVTSNTRGPRFESSHRRNFIHVFTINSIEKTKRKEKRGREWPIFKIGHSWDIDLPISQGQCLRNFTQNMEWRLCIEWPLSKNKFSPNMIRKIWHYSYLKGHRNLPLTTMTMTNYYLKYTKKIGEDFGFQQKVVCDAKLVFKNWPNPGLFWMSFSHHSLNINWKSVVAVLGIRTRGYLKVGADAHATSYTIPIFVR